MQPGPAKGHEAISSVLLAETYFRTYLKLGSGGAGMFLYIDEALSWRRIMPIEHIHPMIVHFPIVLAISALAFDLWGVAAAKPLKRLPAPFNISTILLVAGGIMAIIAYVFGDIAFDIALARGVKEAKLETHETLGTVTAIVLPAIGLIRLHMWRRDLYSSRRAATLALVLSTAAVAMVVVTAYFGGQLVYGLGVNVKPAR